MMPVTMAVVMSCAELWHCKYALLGNKIKIQSTTDQIIKMASNQVMSPARRKWTQFVGTVGARTCNTTLRITMILANFILIFPFQIPIHSKCTYMFSQLPTGASRLRYQLLLF